MIDQNLTDKKSQSSFSNRLTSFTYSSDPDLKTALLHKTIELGDEDKKMRRQYEYKILELQNQLNFAREEVVYKQEVHERQLLNLKALMEYQYTTKTRELKNQLREEYGGYLLECNALKEKNILLEEEIRLMKLKFDRSEKYAKQIEKMSQEKLAKECHTFQEKIQILETNLTKIKKSMTKQHQQQLKQVTLTAQKEKKQFEQKIKNLTQENEKLRTEVTRLNQQIKNQIVQREEIRIEKEKKEQLIKEQEARLIILRQNPVIQGVSAKRQERQARLKELDQNIMSSFSNSDRKQFNTIDLYRTDLQRQILLEKQMKKRWQTQGPTQSQIKRVGKVNASQEIGTSQRKRQESPRFGYKS